MINQWREDVGEDLEDADEEEAHEDPLADLLCQGRLHHPAETEADDGNDDRDHDGRAEHEAFAEGAFVCHGNLFNYFSKLGVRLEKYPWVGPQ